MIFTNKKVQDEIIGSVTISQGEVNFKYRTDYDTKFVSVKDYKKYNDYNSFDGKIALILESPHKEEFDLKSKIKDYFNSDKEVNCRPAVKLETQNGIRHIFNDKLSDFLKNKIGKGKYVVAIINSIKFQCSLGYKTLYYRDLLWFYHWIRNNFSGKSNFIERLSEFNPDIIINGCTSGGNCSTQGKITFKFLKNAFDLSKVDKLKENQKFILKCRRYKSAVHLKDFVEDAIDENLVFFDFNYYKRSSHPSRFGYKDNEIKIEDIDLKAKMAYFLKEDNDL